MVLYDLGVYLKYLPLLYFYYINVISLALNPVYHSQTKHIEVNYQFIREKIIHGDIHI